MALIVDIKKKLGDFRMNLSFESSGGILGILGRSGCGKSMTLKCIAGIEKPDEGHIELDGRVLFDSALKINLPPQKRKVGYLFQSYALFPTMTVEENIAITMNGTKQDKASLVKEQLKRFGLTGLEKLYPGQLSGGQAQRVALARMLVSAPEIILLDEPFSALDSFLKEKLQQDLFDTLSAFDGNVIMVSHDRNEIYKYCPRLMVISDGKSVTTGITKEIFANPGYLEAARISGCKNISKIRRIDERTLEALDWRAVLKTKEDIGEDIHYVGIRAMNVRDVANGNLENAVPVRLLESVQTQFDIMEYCARTDDPEARLCRRYSKYSDDYVKPEEPSFYQLPPEKLLLLRE